MKFDVDDKDRCRLVCVKFHLNRCWFAVADAKCLGGSLFGTQCRLLAVGPYSTTCIHGDCVHCQWPLASKIKLQQKIMCFDYKMLWLDCGRKRELFNLPEALIRKPRVWRKLLAALSLTRSTEELNKYLVSLVP